MRYSFHHFLMLTALAFSTLPILGCGGDDNSKSYIPDFKPQPQQTEDYKYAKAPGTIRLMTYNSFYCKSNTDSKIFSEEHTRNFGEVIKAFHPDVIAIQELDSACNGRSRRYRCKSFSRLQEMIITLSLVLRLLLMVGKLDVA